MRLLLRRSHALVAAAFAAGACTSSTAPIDPALSRFRGTFGLQSFDGVPVPVLQTDYGAIRQYLAADTLVADGQGGYTRVMVTRTDSVGRAYSALQRVATTGTYAVRGDTVDFVLKCPPGALCIIPPTGWFESDGILVVATRYVQGYRRFSRFVRVR